MPSVPPIPSHQYPLMSPENSQPPPQKTDCIIAHFIEVDDTISNDSDAIDMIIRLINRALGEDPYAFDENLSELEPSEQLIAMRALIDQICIVVTHKNIRRPDNCLEEDEALSAIRYMAGGDS